MTDRELWTSLGANARGEMVAGALQRIEQTASALNAVHSLLFCIGEEELTLRASPRDLAALLSILSEQLDCDLNDAQQVCKLGILIEPKPASSDHRPTKEKAAA